MTFQDLIPLLDAASDAEEAAFQANVYAQEARNALEAAERKIDTKQGTYVVPTGDTSIIITVSSDYPGYRNFTYVEAVNV